MRELLQWLPESGWPRLACDAAWQSTIIAGLALVAGRLFVRQPAARAWLMLLALAACVAAPLASAAVRSAGYGWIARGAPMADNPVAERIESRRPATAAPPAMSAERSNASEPITVFNGSNVDYSAPSESTAVAAPANHVGWTVALAGWALASGWMLLRLLLAGVAIVRIARGSTRCDDPKLVDAARRAALAVGLRRAPPIACSEAVSAPALLALGRRLLLVPRSWADDSRIDWFAVFCHEMAHARRGDGWQRLFGELVVAVIPWQPLVWRLRRSLAAASDEACDQRAVAGGSDPVSLATTLAAWAPRRGPALALSAVGRTGVQRRVARLLAMQGVPRARANRGWILGIALLSMMCVGGMAGGQIRDTDARDEISPAKAKATARDSSKAGEAAAESLPAAKPYEIGPSDVLRIETSRLVPREPETIRPGDELKILVDNALVGEPIADTFRVANNGMVALGPSYGRVEVEGLTSEEAEDAVTVHLKRILREPVVSLKIEPGPGRTRIEGDFIVSPDGTIGLGRFGRVFVTRMTIRQASEALQKQLDKDYKQPEVAIDVVQYNSQAIYVIIEGNEDADSLIRLPWTGSETLLDAVAKAKDVRLYEDTVITIGRDNKSIDVPWKKFVQSPEVNRNIPLQFGDRVFIRRPQAK